MNIIEEKYLESTKNILEKNLMINDSRYNDKSIILVYDLSSPVSTELSKWYISNLKNRKNTEMIEFENIDTEILKSKLLWLEEGSTVILVQSTNFRLDNFRIRLNLNNAWVWCLEHRHLAYLYDDQVENYADSIEYRWDYYNKVWWRLKELSDRANTMKFVCKDWSILNVDGGFEDMKLNHWDYEWKTRWGNFPIWENFTEPKLFDNVNGELSIYAYPDDKLQVEFVEPFKIKIKNSIVTCDESKCPDTFNKIMNFISESEDNEVMFRELWFWLNTWISREKQLADVNAYERVCWFHISLWKKHQIYRKKIHKSIVQRYHIDIFPDIKEIYIDDLKVFEKNKYII